MTDHELVYCVKKELLRDPALDAEAIAVSAEGGHVRLCGTVGSSAQMSGAHSAAERVGGVEAVDNHLRVEALSESARADAELCGEVLQLLALHCFVPATTDAEVRDRVVTLTGEVDWQYERDAAGLVAVNAIGVDKVVNKIRLRSKSGASQDVSQQQQQKEWFKMSNGHNVIAVTFDENSKAYEALSVLRQADREGRVVVQSAAIAERKPDGRISIPEGDDNVIGAGAAGGSLIGMLVGVLGGPLGMLLGFGTGAVVGAAVDLDRADVEDDVLSRMSATIPAGKTAVVAELDEYAVDVVDGEMAKLGGTITRRPAGEVLAELEAADEAARASAKEARRVMREAKKAERAQKREQSKEKWDERLAALKGKMSHAGKA